MFDFENRSTSEILHELADAVRNLIARVSELESPTVKAPELTAEEVAAQKRAEIQAQIDALNAELTAAHPTVTLPVTQ